VLILKVARAQDEARKLADEGAFRRSPISADDDR
jgi:hypothetical protein